MARISKTRMSDETEPILVDDAHGYLEKALEDILGIGDEVEIKASIFGVNPESDTPGEATKPVQLNGDIKGILKFSLARAATSASKSVGIDFEDNNTTIRLCFVEDTLRVYEKSGTSWTLLRDLEAVEYAMVQDLPDVSIPAIEHVNPDDPAPLAAGKHLVVGPTGEYYTHAVLSPSGSTTFLGLTDTPDVFTGFDGLGLFSDAGEISFKSYGASHAAWGIEIDTNENILEDNDWAYVYEWVNYNGGTPWSVPTINSDEIHITIPYAGFYYIDTIVTASAHELSGALSLRVDSADANGPACLTNYITSPPVFNFDLSVHPMAPGYSVQHEHSMFSCAEATTISLQALYASASSGPSSIAFSVKMAIVKVA
ncbi:MAG: hypothetical protein KAJ06_09250 [Gammaproteobacteria bacterium]|nr:hypothetical protein [Gammaproteobacteria bacterium]